MNPDTGRIHPIETDEDGVDRVTRPKRSETVERTLERAADRINVLLPDSEPPPGSEVPDDWPRFSIGELVPWKGWFFRVEYVDAEEQRVVIKPLRPTKSTIERRVGRKNRKRRKGGRG